MIKQTIIITILAAILVLSISCGMPGDPVEDLYTRNIYPGTDGLENYQVGSESSPYDKGYFNSIYVSENSIYIAGQKLDLEGLEGVPGSKWYSDIGAPSSELGIVGDWYLDDVNGDVYEKTGDVVWTYRDNLTGLQGVTGPQGSKGDTGNIGPAGTTGPKGDTGDTGATGTSGSQGQQGIQGIQGETGVTGSQGIQGEPGVKGDKGDTGDPGPTHSNITVLDLITEAFTTTLKAAYDGAVTYSHTHSNKTTLDAITEAFTTTLKATYDGLVAASHTHSNMTTLNNITEAFTTALKTSYDAVVTASHSHTNKTLLDTYTQTEANLADAVSKKHSHTNQSVLDATQQSFTTALKTSYDWLVTNITSTWKTTVDTFIASKGAASGLAPLDANSKVPTVNLGGTGASASTYLRGDQTWATPAGGSGLGYTINVQALTSSPTDAQTVYFGMLPKVPTTTANISKVYIRKAGTIKIAEIYCYSGTAGTAESWSLYIRINNTTDTLIKTLAVTTSERVFTNSALSITVAAGDYIEIKGIQPTWATNPLTTIYGGYIYIE